MGFIKNNRLFLKIAEWRNKTAAEQEEYEEEDWSEMEMNKKEPDIYDRNERREYVKNCLDQIVDATRELESLHYEYSMVTSYLKDMEEIENLPEEEMEELKKSAEKIQKLEDQRGIYLEKKNRMSDEKFQQVRRMEEEAEEACRKLAEAEDYQYKIKQDMTRLDGEKHAFLYRKNELQGMIADIKGIAAIGSAALVLCLLVLLALQYAAGMDTQLGFLLTAAAAALGITVIYSKYTEAVRELKRVEQGINKIIMLHNRVKIRYVNNTNLLDYLYMKYQVSGAKEMQTLWDKYREEKEERKKYREAEMELDEYHQELLSLLKCYQIKDPSVWLRQTAAILDSKEMVEIRHNLIVRRQSLRKRIDYNKDVVIVKAQAEIKGLVERYPQYAKEITDMVGKYEGRG